MTLVDGVWVEWWRSPRIVFIPEAYTEISIQDLVDTLRDIEDEPINLSEPHLIDATGKEQLTTTSQVGITAELQNTKLAFESRQTQRSEGTVTTADPLGATLIDSAGTFETDLVMPGDWIVNHPDMSVATVLEVIDEFTLECIPLDSGTTNDWGIGDSYEIFPVIQCSITGGNLVAVDDVGDSMSAILPTAGTQVTYGASSSATLVGSGSAEDIADAVWDEVLTGVTHNIPTSAGRRLRQLGDAVPGDVNDASPTLLSFDTTVTGKADGFYNDQYIRFSDGNLEGQVRVVESYLGTNGTIIVDEEWTEAPANGDSFDLLPVHIHPHGQLADEIWNSQLVNYVISGTAGFALRNMLDFADRILGLSQENYYLDQTSYISFEDQKYMTGGRIRIYDSAGSVGTANDVKATYTITATWTDDEMDNYSVTKI